MWGYSSTGRAIVLQAIGFYEFESRYLHHIWGCSSIWLEHRTVSPKVVGSNPIILAILSHSSSGQDATLSRQKPEFESPVGHHIFGVLVQWLGHEPFKLVSRVQFSGTLPQFICGVSSFSRTLRCQRRGEGSITPTPLHIWCSQCNGNTADCGSAIQSSNLCGRPRLILYFEDLQTSKNDIEQRTFERPIAAI